MNNLQLPNYSFTIFVTVREEENWIMTMLPEGTGKKKVKRMEKKRLQLQQNKDDQSSTGRLGSIASRVLMKVLYAARMARYDLLRPCNVLATRITKWDRTCDNMLHRMMSYINSSLDKRMWSWISQNKSSQKDLTCNVFCDADFASCPQTARSTTRVYLA